MKKNLYYLVFVLLFVGCNKQDDLMLTPSPKKVDNQSFEKAICTSGFEISAGNATNIGGNCGIALNAAANVTFNCNTNSCNQSSSLASGQLYRITTSLASLNNLSSLLVQNNGSNPVMVRVIAYQSSTSSQIVVSCKQLPASNGNINIRVCNKAGIPANTTSIRYEIYAGSGSTSFGWALNK